MLSSLILAAAVSSPSVNAKPVDPCDLGEWPSSFTTIASPTFADLQQFYLLEAPELLTSKPIVEAAEATAKAYKRAEWAKRADEVSNAVYRAQIKTLEAQCKTRWEAERKLPDLMSSDWGAAGIIEESYARVLAHTNLREDPEESGKLLPYAFSKNLTMRVSAVTLSLACSTATPAIASLLSEAKVHCGLITNQSGR